MGKPIGITIPIQLGAHGYFSTTDSPNVQIRSNLINLLLTRKGERAFQPSFGCDIPRVSFETNTDDNLAEIHAIIETSVALWMPFIQIDNVQVEVPDKDGHLVVVKIEYTILTTNVTDSIQLVF